MKIIKMKKNQYLLKIIICSFAIVSSFNNLLAQVNQNRAASEIP